MAIPPNIPTSFVPKQAIQASSPQTFRRHGANPINIVAPVILLVAVLAAGAVYGYQEYLGRVKTARAAELTAKEQGINQQAVQEFIRLRDRLSVGNKLLKDHVMLTSFFTKLEAMTLQSVRFRTLSVTIAADKSAEVQMTGEAKSFNALAAQSTAFSSDPDIRRAIFSGVRQNKDGGIDFSLTATLAPNLVVAGVEAVPKSAPTESMALPVATTTATTSAKTVATTTKQTATSTAPGAPKAATTTP